MTEKLYYWAENLDGYSSDNVQNYDQVIEIKRLNFFIGKNNVGKSRFLRNLFISSNTSQEYVPIIDSSKKRIILTSIDDFITQNNQITIPQKFTDIENYKEQLNILLQDFFFTSKSKDYTIKNLNYFKELRSGYYSITDAYEAIYKELQLMEKSLKNIFNKVFYIPILRGMRPFQNENFASEKTAIITNRTIDDYFKEYSFDNDTNRLLSKSSSPTRKYEFESKEFKYILTGESFYGELLKLLLGEPEDRELIANYQIKLSSYFFDNQTITLIPKINDDVIHIKIGDEPQFPIYQLGDGLQQVITLTYEAFIKNNETHAFFIEEPELHMHAGMVRQLMNFYLNETKHYYFFTTHSNHLLDMADESDQVIIQKFVKQPKENPKDGFDFKIYRCDRDRDLLASLGVKPSSVYLANCTIWVEGITDRLYITKYMEKYLDELKISDEELYKKYRRFMPNYHYTFVEYAGSNLTHWSFSDDYADHLDDKGLSAKAVASEMLLIADGDIQNKADRVEILQSELNAENYFILSCKETENTLPFNVIIRVATNRFERMNSETKDGYNIELINNISDNSYFDNTEFGIGRLLDEAIKIPNQIPSKNPFADGTGVGTIKKKLDFCREIIKDFDENPDWQLTLKAKELCEHIFQHIEKCNR
ncbi:AAA family ATPase [Acinetobacter sp. P8-3-8]|uniref:AAA family ATPase n=1 Tax=Acinetobacter sp. P8-3-8 TaxID=1029823 RepID=UPI0002487E42|nr:AAA family ATPase [Acinetobacter sp. P8-3-8]